MLFLDGRIQHGSFHLLLALSSQPSSMISQFQGFRIRYSIQTCSVFFCKAPSVISTYSDKKCVRDREQIVSWHRFAKETGFLSHGSPEVGKHHVLSDPEATNVPWSNVLGSHEAQNHTSSSPFRFLSHTRLLSILV